MMMGIGLSLATLGAILRYAIDDDWEAMDVGAVGIIMMIVGTIAFGTGVALEILKRPRAATAPLTPTPPAPPAVTPPPQQPPAPPQPH